MFPPNVKWPRVVPEFTGREKRAHHLGTREKGDWEIFKKEESPALSLAGFDETIRAGYPSPHLTGATFFHISIARLRQKALKTSCLFRPVRPSYYSMAAL